MLGERPFFILLLLVLAAVAGAWLARRFSRQSKSDESTANGLKPDYFKGLNYLLNEQPDKAIEVFIRMAEVDNETVETHFALGNLFRRRGEVDRAIRIHQNLIARPNLDKAQRDQALFALAVDFQKAGLFDRAEKLFLQLSVVPGQRRASMQSLVSIYEQQKDWQQSIEIRRKLGGNSVLDNRGIAHAYCELAQAAINSGDLVAARGFLRKARVKNIDLVRSALMRAQVAESEHDHKAAIKLLRWVVEQDPSFSLEVLPAILKNLNTGARKADDKIFSSMLKKQPQLAKPMALSTILHHAYGHPVLMQNLREFFNTDAFAHRLLQTTCGDKAAVADELDDERLIELSEVLAELLQTRPRYACRDCGYSSNLLYWQCPGCKDWDSTRPVAELT